MSEYQEDLEIDKYNLHEQWEIQPSLYIKWAEKSAEAMYERDKAKEQLDLISAEVEFEIRNNPLNYGLKEKPTESAIKSKIIIDEKYIKSNENYLLSKKNAAIISGVLVALEHKKKALEAEVSLWLGGYYSEIKVPQEMHKQIKQVNDNKIVKKLKKRVRE